MEYNQIIQGNTLTVLQTLPPEIVNCCVTSPPYWGLRDYGIEPVIWDGNKDCKHNFITKERSLHGGNTKSKIPELSGQETDWVIKDGFCLKCGAWRGSLGLEPTFELYIKHLCDIFDQVKRVLRKDGTCFVNLGDSYGGSGNASGHTKDTKNLGYKTLEMGATKGHTLGLTPKSQCAIPERFLIEMLNRGWIKRNTIIWHKPNCMPSSARDRFTVDFEYVYFFVRSKKYWFEQAFDEHTTKDDLDRRTNKFWSNDIADGGTGKQNKGRDRREFYGANGRNKRAVWTINTKPFPEAHFAVYPEALIEPMIQAGCPKGGIVLDPFIGAGTTAVVAKKQGKQYLGIELKQEYIDMANKRIRSIPESLF